MSYGKKNAGTVSDENDQPAKIGMEYTWVCKWKQSRKVKKT